MNWGSDSKLLLALSILTTISAPAFAVECRSVGGHVRPVNVTVMTDGNKMPETITGISNREEVAGIA
ncbi:hypothetical protein LB543_24475 [Mesorhizobium sp. ESP7-2]|uniref:hypothetical protein n=1 Tax=Mesorhizobium sp. ESP7-2 TaxID=2876622 RepID=UPI001CCC8C7E|nr:hypothetical protein [Mesorhizobium sp. ESP7-2]MBZ9709865.1 hypothetical protein [Mesorhizobium sp. ESP7-2]